MINRPPCTKCQGSGVVTREGDEARKDLYPSLSATKGLCDRCGGSTYEPAADQRRANVDAAKSAES